MFLVFFSESKMAPLWPFGWHPPASLGPDAHGHIGKSPRQLRQLLAFTKQQIGTTKPETCVWCCIGIIDMQYSYDIFHVHISYRYIVSYDSYTYLMSISHTKCSSLHSRIAKASCSDALSCANEASAFWILESRASWWHLHSRMFNISVFHEHQYYALNDPGSNVQKNVDDWVQQNQRCPYTVDSMKWSLTRCRNTKSMFMTLCGHDAQALFFGSILNFSQLHDNINSIIVLQNSWLLGEAGKLQDIDEKLHYNVSCCPLPDRSPSSTAPHLRKF